MTKCDKGVRAKIFAQNSVTSFVEYPSAVSTIFERKKYLSKMKNLPKHHGAGPGSTNGGCSRCAAQYGYYWLVYCISRRNKIPDDKFDFDFFHYHV